MLTVHNGELMVEEKGIYSIEKFLVARRQMYWQVYLHKTVVAAEMMMVNALKRVRELSKETTEGLATGGAMDFFLYQFDGTMNTKTLQQFCELDDDDVSFAVKRWSHHKDFVLSQLSKRLLNRQLLKVKFQAEPFTEQLLDCRQTLVLPYHIIIYKVFAKHIEIIRVFDTRQNPSKITTLASK